jgi:hypothetical protein
LASSVPENPKSEKGKAKGKGKGKGKSKGKREKEISPLSSICGEKISLAAYSLELV